MNASLSSSATDVASVARMTDYLRYGKNHFARDREAAELLLDAVPDFRRLLYDSQCFTFRAAARLASLGFDYFADLGCGLPVHPSVHDVVRESQPRARLVSVDVDLEATVHTRVHIAGDDGAEVLTADVRDMARLLEHPRVEDMLRPDNRVVVMAAGLLQFLTDDEAATVISSWRRHLPVAGRFLVSHICRVDASAAQVAAVRQAYSAAAVEIHVRSREQIEALFDGWIWLNPGLGPVKGWQLPPQERRGKPGTDIEFFGGVAMPQYGDFENMSPGMVAI